MKTILEELLERPIPLLKEPKLVSVLNDAAADIVLRYFSAEEIFLGPAEDDITLYGAPIDILPFLPLVDRKISMWGKFGVWQYRKYIGRVQYDGWPVQADPSRPFIGANTTFVPAEPMSAAEIQIMFGD